ncbi:adenylate/guanylate cyclase domain-containing protein [Hyunsoonleella sp. SJ7]|uniref:Adenylate/guanylate cyclase domain-containing protein n=1 Tax=Hyunsoonleella aquatilis TaxID=2762758 RepID=A0A923HBI1_9FLAO|nr:adenylate/guanylate cyclase domain-containing protein [Hyunsoonleella aquatilis]MBC3758036.1 adenylate/guanylate cyclase domain-containing protein [Hyunsoonleella aquatilis]
MSLHANHIRNIRLILSFAVIWLFFGFCYALLEYGIIGRTGFYPATGNKYHFRSSLVAICIGSFLMGFIQGGIEVLWLKKQFRNKSLWVKMLFKSVFYLALTVTFLLVFGLVYTARVNQVSVFDPFVLELITQFVQTFSFWAIVIYVGLALDVALFYSEMEEYFGTDLLPKYMGRYHRPKEEVCTFMFLDMKSSTTIAERLGSETYFELLRAYYANMSNAILETSGQVYQYVGDEIVVTWNEKSGIENNNCLHCFFKIEDAVNRKKSYYQKKFGLVPEFKAGYHIGKVTTGEIGIIKKDIVHTGDILNTASRIQDKCNALNSKVLISKELRERLGDADVFSFEEVDKLLLRGKTSEVQLYSVTRL